MFREILGRELKGAFKSPMLYIFTFIFALMSFMAVVSDSVQIGGAIGAVNKNAPHIVTVFTTIMSFLGLLFAVAFFNNAALRDFEHQFDEILFSTPLKKSAYYFGRFGGALILSTIPLLGVYLGIVLGSLLGPVFDWIPADRIGPTPWRAFLNNYLLFVVPNTFLGGALIFAMAQQWRNTIVSFVGALGIIVAYFIAGNFLSDLENIRLAAFSDPFGVRTYSVESRYYTTVEKNTLPPSFSGLILYNRLIWTGLATVVLYLSYLRFKPQKIRKSLFKKKEKKRQVKAENTRPDLHKPAAEQSFSGSLNFKHYLSFLRDSNRSIFKSTVFRILLAFTVILLISNLANGFEYFGLKSYPLTYKIVDAISSSSGIFMLIVIVFFSGELIWRDRMAHINEVISATPHRSFTQLLAYASSLVLVCISLYLTFSIIGVCFQLLDGFTSIEWSLYIKELLYDALPGFILFSCLHLFIQVVANHRYIGYFISVLSLFVLDILWNVLDIQSNMLSLGSGPSLYYSDLNGFGPGFTGAMWFNLYWMLFGLLLLTLAGTIVNRYKINGLKARLKTARQNTQGRYLTGIATVLVLWLGTASFVFYNTQVLNTYKTSDQWEELRADYEKTYKHYQERPLPKIVSTEYFIDIFPEQRDVLVEAHIKLVNKTTQSIDSLFFTLDDNWETEIILPNGKQAWLDETFGFAAYALGKTLAPGDTLPMTIKNKYITQGFTNSTGNTSIIRNGTFLNNRSILPAFGYTESFELSDRNTRKKYGLKPKPRMPELREDCGELCMNNYLSDGLSDWVQVETVISTSEEQLAIAPGSLLRKWKENGRNYFHYRLDHESQDFYSFISARYEKAYRQWNDIDLEVYYDAKHNYNIERMLDAMEKSLQYYTENFGPYYHKQARIIEFPRYSTFAQAFPGTMPYSESFGFIINLEDESENNIVDAVIAHEMAHQWWAHQEVSARMQGSTFLTESFSEYSSLMVMKQENDPIAMREFLKYDMDRYLRGRSSETEKESPLLKVENQSYIHYGKGSIILYALQEMVGEDSVNAAMRSFLKEYRYAPPPYPTSLDFMRHLEPRIPDSLHYLLDDWIREITLYDFRLEKAQYQLEDDSSYAVTINLFAQKIKADTLGTEREVAINDWVDLGFYADAEEEELLLEKRVKIDRKDMKMTFHLDTLPAKAAIDPRRIYIERIIEDNVKKLEAAEKKN